MSQPAGGGGGGDVPDLVQRFQKFELMAAEPAGPADADAAMEGVQSGAPDPARDSLDPFDAGYLAPPAEHQAAVAATMHTSGAIPALVQLISAPRPADWTEHSYCETMQEVLPLISPSTARRVQTPSWWPARWRR